MCRLKSASTFKKITFVITVIIIYYIIVCNCCRSLAATTFLFFAGQPVLKVVVGTSFIQLGVCSVGPHTLSHLNPLPLPHVVSLSLNLPLPPPLQFLQQMEKSLSLSLSRSLSLCLSLSRTGRMPAPIIFTPRPTKSFSCSQNNPYPPHLSLSPITPFSIPPPPPSATLSQSMDWERISRFLLPPICLHQNLLPLPPPLQPALPLNGLGIDLPLPSSSSSSCSSFSSTIRASPAGPPTGWAGNRPPSPLLLLLLLHHGLSSRPSHWMGWENTSLSSHSS